MAEDSVAIAAQAGGKEIHLRDRIVGGVTRKDEVFQHEWAELDYSAGSQLTAVATVQNSADIDCEGKEYIAIHVTYSANNVTAPFRVWLKDKQVTARYSLSQQITPGNTAIADKIDTARFVGELIVLPTYGAKMYQIRLDGVPTNGGNVSAFGTAV